MIDPYVDYSPIIDRPIIKWPNDARVALWVAPNVEFYEYTPLSRPMHPDVPGYAHRDGGNRACFWRMLEVMDKHGIRCTVSLNGGILEHFPEIRDAMVERNWEFMSHGVYNTRPINRYRVEEERAFYRDIIETLKKHTGKQLKGMLSPGTGASVNTMDLMAEAGLIYVADWHHDDQPIPIKVKTGKLVSVSYPVEINDIDVYPYGEAEYFGQITKDNFDVLYQESAVSGRVMCIALHPFVVGQPHWAKYLDEALGYILAHDGVWLTTGVEIAEYYIANYYDKFVAHVEKQKRDGLVV